MPTSSCVPSLALMMLLLGCSSSYGGDAAADASLRLDSGPIEMDSGPIEMDAGSSPAGPAVCGLTTCATGQICCFTSLTCFDLSTPAACPRPMVDAGVSGPPPCASNADCAAAEFCDTDLGAAGGISGRCGGPGVCVRRRTPDRCGGFAEGVCGCDGHTYPTPCDASLVGVRTSTMYPCGDRVYPSGGGGFGCPCPPDWHCDLDAGECAPDQAIYSCGVGGACPAATTCCPMLGLCLDSTRPDLCRIPPDGTRLPCADNSDCAVLSLGPMPSPEYCDGEGCSGPAGCRLPESGCSGVLTPVCGCDGMPYTNACWASNVSVRVAHDGTCP